MIKTTLGNASLAALFAVLMGGLPVRTVAQSDSPAQVWAGQFSLSVLAKSQTPSHFSVEAKESGVIPLTGMRSGAEHLLEVGHYPLYRQGAPSGSAGYFRSWPALPQVTQDTDNLYILKREVLYKVRKSDLATTAKRAIDSYVPDIFDRSRKLPASLPPTSPRVTFHDRKNKLTHVRDVLQALFRQAKASYTVAAGIQDMVRAEFKNVPLHQALAALGAQAGFKTRFENGQYIIFSVRPVAEYVEPFDRNLVSDQEFLYFIEGRKITKYRKGDLEPVARGELPELD
jgi:hypothetical protein